MNNVFYINDKEYPSLLRKTGKEAPKQIYYKVKASKTKFLKSLSPSLASLEQHAHTYDSKNLFFSQNILDKSIFDNCLTVIGSRKLTSYGQRVTEQLVREIAGVGVTIVSGFMYGGDAMAHQAAVDAGGRTVAVMPCGIDLIHPTHQEKLYQDILENKGLIISEYKGDMKPKLWTYPQRNRITAGLSKALLVIEAGEKSGCLITAKYAKKFKRKIFAVPGPITGQVSKGTNFLIKQGAEIVTSAQDVLRYYPNCHSESADEESNRSFANAQDDKGVAQDDKKIERQVLKMLAREMLTIDELSRELEISSSELGVKLSIMEVQGLIKIRGGKYGVE